MNSLVMALAITCGFLLVTCLYLAAKGKSYKDALAHECYLVQDYYDKLIREKKAHNHLKKTK